MATLAGRIAEQGLKLLNEIAAEAWSLESFASSGLDRLPRLVASEVTTLSICDLARGRRTAFSTPNRAFSAGASASGSLTVGRSGRALRVRLVPNPASVGGYLLFISLAVEADFPVSAAGAALIPREREVLQWAATGKTNVKIGAILDMSPRTVEKHFEHIFEKLGVETRMAAVMRLLAGSPRG